jgi:hypothetical protein
MVYLLYSVVLFLRVLPTLVDSLLAHDLSPELGPPPCHPQESDAPPTFGSRGRDRLATRGGGGGPNLDEMVKTLRYSRYTVHLRSHSPCTVLPEVIPEFCTPPCTLVVLYPFPNLCVQVLLSYSLT